MLYGGMPKVLLIEDESEKKRYLSDLFNQLYIKDIVERNKIERKEQIDVIEPIFREVYDKSRALGFGPICYEKYLKQQKTYLFEMGDNYEVINKAGI